MTDGPRLLLVEDDAALRSSLRLTLRDEDFDVLEAGTGREGLARFDGVPGAEVEPVHAVLLDRGLPDMDGIEVCRRIRAVSGVPVLVISARARPSDVAAALATGADDYVPKPFAVADLVHRIRALLRPPRRVEVGDLHRRVRLQLRPDDDTVLSGGRPIPLTRTEFRVLCELAAEPGRAVPSRTLLRQIWGRESAAATAVLEARIASLAGKLDAKDSTIVQITGAAGGYRLET